MERAQRADAIGIHELALFLYHRIGYVVLAAVICAVVAFFYTVFFVTPLYTSTTSMYILNQQSDNAITSSDLQSSTYLTRDYIEIAVSRTVLQAVIDSLKLDMSYEMLKSSVEVTAASDTRIVKISVKNTDPLMARNIADEIRLAATERIRQVMNIAAVNVVDAANLPEEPSGPHLWANVGRASGAGALVALAGLVLLALADDRITSVEDVESYLEIGVLGAVPLEAEKPKGRTKKHKWLKKYPGSKKISGKGTE